MRTPDVNNAQSTLIRPSIENNSHIENDFLIANYNSLSEAIGELKESAIDSKNRLCTIENLVKDNNQSQKILELEKAVENLTSQLQNQSNSSSAELKKTICISFPLKPNILIRAEEFGQNLTSDGYASVKGKQLLLEYKERLPKIFTFHITGYVESNWQAEQELFKYKVHVGSLKNKERYTQEFELIKYNYNNYPCLTFETKGEFNNIITIVMPELKVGRASILIKSLKVIERTEEEI